MKKFTMTTLGIFTLIIPQQAMSAQTVIPFSGAVQNTCVITAQAPGVLGADTNMQNLGTTHGVGAPGTATVLSTGTGLEVNVSEVSSFTAAPVGGAADNWTTRYNLSGTSGNTAANVTGGISTPLTNHGITDVTVHVNAEKTGADVFPAGTYATQVILTCE